jgi:hypothetical protein
MHAYRTHKAHGKGPLDAAVSPRRDPDHHAFFDARKKANTGNVLHVAHQRGRFVQTFDHVLGRYAKQEADDHTVIVVLIARGSRKALAGWERYSTSGITRFP